MTERVPINVIQKFQLADKFLGITLDNASNNTVFMEKLAEDNSNDFSLFYHIRCFAHVLNLGAQAALSVIRGIKKLKVARKLWRSLKNYNYSGVLKNHGKQN